MNDQLTRALKQTGDRFADQHVADLSLDGVLRRAGEIRRGRRMRATMVMAAVVLAIAVPVGITVMGNSDHAKEPVPAPSVDHSDITIDRVPTGPAPKTAYAYGGKLYGGERPIAYDKPISFMARIDGGFLVASGDDQGNNTAAFVSDDGHTLEKTWPVNGSFVVSPEGNVGAFAQPDGTVVAVQDAGSLYFDVGTVPDIKGDGSFVAAAMTGENCSGRSEEVGCTIYVRDQEISGAIGAVSPHREPVLVHPALRSLIGISPSGDSAGMVSATDTGSCWAVLDESDTELWKTCANSFNAFSPSGRYLLAGPAYLDGAGSGELAVLEAGTGKPVLALKTGADAILTHVVWEDDEHLLAAVIQNDDVAVLRIDLNGNREIALPTVRTEESYISPYLLDGN